jgi:uncharacterized protein YecT (DUF1311 family)
MRGIVIVIVGVIFICSSINFANADSTSVVVTCNPAKKQLLVEYFTAFGVSAVRPKEPATTQIIDLWDLVTIEKCPKGDACSVKSEQDKIITCQLDNSLFHVIITPLPFNPDNLQGACGAAITGSITVMKDDKIFLEETQLQSQACEKLYKETEKIVGSIEVLPWLKTARITEIFNTDEYKLSETSTWTFAPSFDCSKPLGSAEKMICSDRELSDKDVSLSFSFVQALKKSSNKNALKKEQNAWRKNIRDRCTDRQCILNAYDARIKKLDISE